ncbi:zinc ribbon domain-containing protein [Thermotoga profunda]|uniref:zinc ribbon domain-containing protein n=1 Tax=Thermotoga profunda TaxID=1508420 RepID=UPI0005976413
MKQWHQGKFSKSVQYSGIGSIKRRLGYNLRTQVHVLDRFQPTTKTCSNCGTKIDIALSERTFNCPNCRLSIDRDLNSAYNMLRFVGLDRPEVTPVEKETTVRIFGENPNVLISFLR